MLLRPSGLCNESKGRSATELVEKGITRLLLLGSISLGSKDEQVDDARRVSPLVLWIPGGSAPISTISASDSCTYVVPTDQLDEVRVECDTGLDIEDGGVDVADEVSGYYTVFGVADNSLTVHDLSYAVERWKRNVAPCTSPRKLP